MEGILPPPQHLGVRRVPREDGRQGAEKDRQLHEEAARDF